MIFIFFTAYQPFLSYLETKTYFGFQEVVYSTGVLKRSPISILRQVQCCLNLEIGYFLRDLTVGRSQEKTQNYEVEIRNLKQKKYNPFLVENGENNENAVRFFGGDLLLLCHQQYLC